MHLRFTSALGLPIVEEHTQEFCGVLSGILIHPDTGRIEGFFVAVPGFLRSEQLFLSVLDIRAWGMRIAVRDRDVLGLAQDRVRLQPLLEDSRTLLGQRMQTESGKPLGVCRDVQFSTEFFQVEWLFPKRFWKWKLPIPLTEVLEVRTDAIIIKDPQKTVAEPVEEKQKAPMLKVPEMA